MLITVSCGGELLKAYLRDECSLETSNDYVISELGSNPHIASGVPRFKDGLDILPMDGAKTMATYFDMFEKCEKLENERKCRQLFEKMQNSETKSEIYFSWKPLHDQFIYNPTDYEDFKVEYDAYMEVEDLKQTFMSDPTSIEGQKLVQDKLRTENWNLLYHEAKKKIPEAFVPIPMIFIRLLINGVSTIAIVDSGSFASYIDPFFANKAGLGHKIDTRTRQVGFGVGGVHRADGCIFSCPLEVDEATFDANLNVEDLNFEVLLGLDFLRFHSAYIDLPKNRMVLNESVFVEFISLTEIEEWQDACEKPSSFKADDEKLAELVGMGFDKEEAEWHLEYTMNDLPDAVRSLYYWAQEDLNAKANQTGTVYDASSEAKTVALDQYAQSCRHNIDCESKRISEEELMNDCKCEKLDTFMPEISEEEMQKKCMQLFQEMNKAKTKCEIYFAWKPLHDLFIRNPADCEGFRREYAVFMASERNKFEIMQNPASVEGQELILKKILIENWDRMKLKAKGRMPEVFATIPMLYVRVVVKGIATIALIDTGAYNSSFSSSFAKKADVDQQIDSRNRELRSGFGGRVKTVGIIWLCSFEIGNSKFEGKFDVRHGYFDMIIGLDFLLRYKCSINLPNNRLIFNDNMQVEFLSDAEIEEWKKGREKYDHQSFKIDDDKLAELIAIGFDKKNAEEALMDTANDVPDAVRKLYEEAEIEEEKNSVSGKMEE